MKRLALVLAAAAFALPSAAQGAACSPLNCAASQFTIGQYGSLLGFRAAIGKPVTVVDLETGKTRWVLPAGLTGGSLLVHQDGRALAWYDASRGTRLATITLPDVEYSLAGVSQDGTRAVLTRVSPNGTRFLVASRHAQRLFTLAGKQWSFDALRGDNLFLIKYLALGGYQVRLVHVGTGRLDPKPLKDPHESSTIWGSPFSRLSSADGRYLFTLYLGPNGGSMIHVLDLQAATARCVDLPGTGNYGSATTWTLALSRDQSKLWAVSPGYGRVVAIDVPSRKVSDAFRIDLPYWNVGNTTSAALAPDGRHIALGNGEAVAVVGLAERKVVQRDKAHAVALGYSPAGRLWQLS
ncbi:MAG TPA: hypothetical protein VIJ70_12145 [Gaiellaceae bacterium]